MMEMILQIMWKQNWSISLMDDKTNLENEYSCSVWKASVGLYMCLRESFFDNSALKQILRLKNIEGKYVKKYQFRINEKFNKIIICDR